MTWEIRETGRWATVRAAGPPPVGAVARWSPPQVRGGLVASTTPLGGRLLPSSLDVDEWFRRHWFSPAPPHLWTGDAVVATVEASGYATLVSIGGGVRAVYLAAWLGDATVPPTVTAPYVGQFRRLGYQVSIDEGGLVAEQHAGGADPTDAVVHTMHAAALLAHLARDLIGISSLPGH